MVGPDPTAKPKNVEVFIPHFLRLASARRKGEGLSTMRSGGEADKIANSYEGLWTTDQLFDLLDGEAELLEPEPLIDGVGIEFVKTLPGGIREFHSVKVRTAENSWTIAVLTRPNPDTGRSVLGDLLAKTLADPSNHSYFISIVPANALDILCDDARRSGDFATFRRALDGADHVRRRDFHDRIVPICDGSEESAFDQLRRVHVVSINEEVLKKNVEREIRKGFYRTDLNPLNLGDVRRLLAEVIEDNMRQRIDHEKLTARLSAEGLRETNWAAHDSLPKQQVEARNETYFRHVTQQLINGSQIHREETNEAFTWITQGDGQFGVFVGSAGLGKSCAAAELVLSLQSAGIPYLAIRLDIQPNEMTAQGFGQLLGLPTSPVDVLEGIARGGLSVLIIDQLDALSFVSGRNQNLWAVFEDLIREAEEYPKLKILVACRAFDLENDPRLRTLIARKKANRIPLRLFAVDLVKTEVQKSGFDPGTLSLRQLELLRVPMHLSLFLESDPAGKPPFQTVQDLYDQYWDRKQDFLKEQLGRPCLWREVIDALCNELSRRQTLSAPADPIDDAYHDDARAMASANVIVEENGTYRFFHEGFFDYAFARRFAAKGGKILDLLLNGGEQHLFRRGQVRQILTYLRSKDNQTYLIELEQLLTEGRVRTHLKRLVLDWMRTLTDPSAEEARILELDVV